MAVLARRLRLGVLEMSPERDAIHAIRNDLTPILWFAELANAGDREAHRLVIKELVNRSNAINAELDILTTAIRRQQPARV
jgi:hypothetical protein